MVLKTTIIQSKNKPYSKTVGNGDEGGEAPFRCPNSGLVTGLANQEVGTTYNRNFGSSSENMGTDFQKLKNSTKQIGEIFAPVETGVVTDSTDDVATYNNLLPTSNGVGNRHNGGINILWADGHVQWYATPTIQAGKNGIINYYLVVDKVTETFQIIEIKYLQIIMVSTCGSLTHSCKELYLKAHTSLLPPSEGPDPQKKCVGERP